VKAAPDRRAGVFIDESWWVLWPHPTSTWARRRRPQRVPKAKSWTQAEQPPSRCLYAGMDVCEQEVQGEWHRTWNQEETWQYLQGVIARYAAQGRQYLVVFWDNAPWHVAVGLRERVAAYNQQAKREDTLRVLLFFLPSKSPWLMPLEGVFGQTKRAVGLRQRATIEPLQDAVERRLQWRNARVRDRRKQAHSSTSLVSV
jgi:transposase